MLCSFIGAKSVTSILAVVLWILGFPFLAEIMEINAYDYTWFYYGTLVLGALAVVFIAPKVLRIASKISPERQRHMAFSYVLINRNLETVDTFKVLTSTAFMQRIGLRQMWGITSREDVLEIAQSLSQAGSHTPFADEIYHKIIKSSLKHEEYDEQKKILIEKGYTERELSQIKTLAAWDYGRTAYVLRFSAHAGYIKQKEAWTYMKAAADNAAREYDSWRQFFAAYHLGRAIAFGEVTEFDTTLNPSIFDKRPFSKIDFK